MSNSISWDDQRIFLAVLEEGSFSAAVRRLGLSHPTVRSRIEALEQNLGTVLFTRSVHGLTPTDTAEALRASARAMAAASELFVRQATASADRVAGTVRISAPELMGVEVIPGMLRTLHDAYPEIDIELSPNNMVEDVVAREVDIAVRTVTPKQAALVMRKVASIDLGFFASRDYLARRGMPGSLSELGAHDLIGPDRSVSELHIVKRLNMVPKSFVLRTDSHPAQLAAARAGLGIAPMQIPLCSGDPLLLRVLPDFIIDTLGTWIVTHENLLQTPRIRVVFDALVNGFKRWMTTAA